MAVFFLRPDPDVKSGPGLATLSSRKARFLLMHN
jgi:hypothetical protein